jgi:hypothetical protein
MKNIELLQKVADLVGFKFSSVSAESFAETKLFDGKVITNASSGDFVVGDTITIKNADGTFSPLEAGEHTLADEALIYVIDVDGKLLEIKHSTPEGEDGGEEGLGMAPENEMMESSQLDALKAAIHDVLFAFEAHTKEISNLKADLEAFKKEAKHEPLKNETLMTNAFSTDRRYEILKQMKESNRK